MARGIPFGEANLVLRAPTPEDAAAGTVYDLHVHRYRDLDGQQNVLSKWQFTPEELADLVRNEGQFWFNCWGTTHPPIAIFASDPFRRVAAPIERECSLSPDGRHQVDTSMESGPNKCFHCGASTGGNARQ